MDTQSINKQVQRHEVAIVEMKQDIKYQFEDVKKTIAAIPHQFQQEMALQWAARDEQKRKEHKEIRMWFWGLIAAFITAASSGWIWLLHERDLVKDDHTIIQQLVVSNKDSAKLANQADYKSDQALSSVSKINDKLDLVIYFHKKQYKE